MKKRTCRAATVTIACMLGVFGAPLTSAAAQQASPGGGGPPPGLGAFPSAAFDDAGRFWVAWVEGSHVVVASSADRGLTFGPAVRATVEEEAIDANGDARPKIAIGAGGEVYVAWTRTGAAPYTGDIRFARSVDGGRTFFAPRTVNDDGLPIGHRFESLGVNDRGELFMVWIDKRDLEQSLAAGETYAGAALYYTWSTDGGETFAPNRKIKDHVCECCRIALAFDASGWPVLVWREVLPGSIRDHGVVRFVDRDRFTEIGRVAVDRWRIDGCPHHGPALARDGDGGYHAVWLTGFSPQGPGVFYAKTSDDTLGFAEPTRVGTRVTLGHADIEALGRHVVIVWKERAKPNATVVQLLESRDAGRTWSPAREVLRTTGVSDHPLLVSDGAAILLAWHTEQEGYRVEPLSTTQDSE